MRDGKAACAELPGLPDASYRLEKNAGKYQNLSRKKFPLFGPFTHAVSGVWVSECVMFFLRALVITSFPFSIFVQRIAPQKGVAFKYGPDQLGVVANGAL